MRGAQLDLRVAFARARGGGARAGGSVVGGAVVGGAVVGGAALAGSRQRSSEARQVGGELGRVGVTRFGPLGEAARDDLVDDAEGEVVRAVAARCGGWLDAQVLA